MKLEHNNTVNLPDQWLTSWLHTCTCDTIPLDKPGWARSVNWN